MTRDRSIVAVPAALTVALVVTLAATSAPSPASTRRTVARARTVRTTTRRVTTTARPTSSRLSERTTTTMQGTFDPYAGTRAAVPAVGRRSEGTISTPDGRVRRYRTYIPSTLSAGAAAPLLIALHGGLGTSAQYEGNSGFDELAEANGFVVVYPDGIGNQPDGSGFQTWNGGYCCGPAATQDVDDVGFVRLLLDTIAAQRPIDTARVFAAGHSNGGILAYRLACELADRIVAIGVQAGSNVVEGCRPALPVSVLHLHGTADTNMPIGGGKGSGIAATSFVPARRAVEAMAAASRCTVGPTTSSDPANPDLAATTWTNPQGTVAVRLVVVDGATHAWMGHPPQSAMGTAYVGAPYERLDASRAIWSFLAAHPRRA